MLVNLSWNLLIQLLRRNACSNIPAFFAAHRTKICNSIQCPFGWTSDGSIIFHRKFINLALCAESEKLSEKHDRNYSNIFGIIFQMLHASFVHLILCGGKGIRLNVALCGPQSFSVSPSLSLRVSLHGRCRALRQAITGTRRLIVNETEIRKLSIFV